MVELFINKIMGRSLLLKLLLILPIFAVLECPEVFTQQSPAERNFMIGNQLQLENIQSGSIHFRNLDDNRTLKAIHVCKMDEWQEMDQRSSLFQIDNLEPATVYRTSLAWEHLDGSRDTSFHLPVITRSNSSGEILVYFNSSVETEFSNGAMAVSTSGTVLRNTIIEKIDQASTSIDVAAYNNNRSEIVQALNNAANRGVRVRYVAEGENANTALNTSLAFQVLERNDDDGIMHHKFLVIDVEDAENSWVIAGSTNLTTQQIATDNNHMLFIQDQSLAVVYEMEFEEMWGSNTSTPNPSQSRFGANKRDNTPHWLMVGDVPVQSYFSPSDNTAFHISATLQEAEENISFALLLFTHNPLAETIIQKHFQGLNVRGLINDIDASGTRYPKLKSNNINVHPNGVSGVQLHHKYAIIDADAATTQPKVITGSHNWTNRANNHNDENTLIIHSTNIANIFRQEFEARWCESVREQCLVSYTIDNRKVTGPYFSVFPNPGNGRIQVDLKDMNATALNSLLVLDQLGRIIKGKMNVSESLKLDMTNFPDGLYHVVIKSDQGVHQVPVIIAR